jgi:hypothetical protein
MRLPCRTGALDRSIGVPVRTVDEAVVVGRSVDVAPAEPAVVVTGIFEVLAQEHRRIVERIARAAHAVAVAVDAERAGLVLGERIRRQEQHGPCCDHHSMHREQCIFGPRAGSLHDLRAMRHMETKYFCCMVVMATIVVAACGAKSDLGAPGERDDPGTGGARERTCLPNCTIGHECCVGSCSGSPVQTPTACCECLPGEVNSMNCAQGTCGG